MKDIENSKKESPFLGLTGMGGGAASLMWAGASLETNTLWFWGQQEEGQFGLNHVNNVSSPIQLGTEDTWTKVSMGYTVLGTKNDGTLWSWGRNGPGSMGINDRTQRSSPCQVGTDTNWVFAHNSRGTTFANKTDGTLWVWGNVGSGLLGLNQSGPTYEYRSSPVQTFGTETRFKDPVMSWSYQDSFHVIDDNNAMWFMGTNRYGNSGRSDLNHNERVSSPIQIPGTWGWVQGSHSNVTFAVKTDGTGWSWGRNSVGQLGIGAQNERSSPCQVPGTWVQTAGVGGNQTLAIQTDGSIYSAGSNGAGALALNNNNQYSNMQQVPGTWTMVGNSGEYGAIGSKDGGKTLWIWGASSYGRLGRSLPPGSPYFRNRSSPMQIPGVWNYISSKHADTRDYRSFALKKP